MLQFDSDSKPRAMTEKDYAEKIWKDTGDAYDCFEESQEDKVPTKAILEWLESIAVLHRALVDTEAYLKSKPGSSVPNFTDMNTKRMIAIISHNLMKVRSFVKLITKLPTTSS